MVVCFLETRWTKQQHWEGCSGMGDGILQWREVVQNLGFKTEHFFLSSTLVDAIDNVMSPHISREGWVS